MTVIFERETLIKCHQHFHISLNFLLFSDIADAATIPDRPDHFGGLIALQEHVWFFVVPESDSTRTSEIYESNCLLQVKLRYR